MYMKVQRPWSQLEAVNALDLKGRSKVVYTNGIFKVIDFITLCASKASKIAKICIQEQYF